MDGVLQEQINSVCWFNEALSNIDIQYKQQAVSISNKQPTAKIHPLSLKKANGF